MSDLRLADERSWASRSGVARLLLPFVTVLALQLQSQYVHYELLGNKGPVEEPGPLYCLLLVIFALLAVLPRALAAISSLLLMGGVTGLFLVDANYYRFFRELPSWHLLPTWRQAGKASESVVVDPGDMMLLLGPAAVLLVALGTWWFDRRRPAHGYPAALAAAVLALGGCGYAYQTLPEVRWIQFQRRFQNVAMAKIFSPLYYHAYDSYEVLRIASGLEGGLDFDQAKISAAIGKSRKLSSEETPFKGMFAGRDVLFLQLESLEYFALEASYKDKPVMPYLQRMAAVGFGFRLFDQTHLGRSADGQFIYLNSLHPPAQRPLAFAYPNNSFESLPKMFIAKGYDTIYMHPSDPSFWNSKLMAAAYGFQTPLFRSELPARNIDKEVRGWGLTDGALFSRVLERSRKIGGKPTFTYVVTMMCHHPYPETRPEDTDFPPPRAESMVRRYLRCCHMRDQAIETLVAQLGKTERGRRTVLVLVGDHDSNVSDAEKRRLDLPSYPESEAVPLVICTVESALSGKPMLASKARPEQKFGAQMDLAPSIGHVFSLAMEQSMFLGGNLFTKQNSGSRISRLGTWMDRRGMIKPPEDSSESLDTTEFEVSEMLLQSNRISEIQGSL